MVKCNFLQALRLCTGRTAHRGSRGMALLFLDHGTRRGWGVIVTPRPLFTPWKDPVPIVQEAGWAPESVWTGAENLDPPPGFDPRTFQPVASRYADWPTRLATKIELSEFTDKKALWIVTKRKITYWKLHLNFALMFKRQICYTRKTDVLQFTVIVQITPPTSQQLCNW